MQEIKKARTREGKPASLFFHKLTFKFPLNEPQTEHNLCAYKVVKKSIVKTICKTRYANFKLFHVTMFEFCFPHLTQQQWQKEETEGGEMDVG